MPAAFVITAASAGLEQALSRAGLPPERVERLYWGGRSLPPVAGGSWATVRLPAGPSAGVQAVLLAAEALLAGDARLVTAGSLAEAVLLASPEAVGSLNLSPCAEIVGRGLAPGPDEALQRGLKQAGLAPAALDWLVLAGRLPPGVHGSLGIDAGRVAAARRPALEPLIRILERKRLKYGVLIATGPDGSAALVLERV